MHTVKVNGPAKRPDSTVLYYHRTETTLRLDDLLGEQWITAVGFNTSKRSIKGCKMAAASFSRILYFCHNVTCDVKAGGFPWLVLRPKA